MSLAVSFKLFNTFIDTTAAWREEKSRRIFAGVPGTWKIVGSSSNEEEKVKHGSLPKMHGLHANYLRWHQGF
jgi:hypothetical protein